MFGRVGDIAKRCYDDPRFRNEFFLKLNTAVTIFLTMFQALSGYLADSTYMYAISAYYAVILVMRVILVSGIDLEPVREWRRYRICALIVLLATIPLISMNTLLLSGEAEISYPGYLVYGVATLCTYNVTIAIIGFFTGRKSVSPVFLASKNFNIIIASVSLFTLQSALITAFGDDPDFQLIMGASVGMAVFAMVIVLSCFMIRNSTRKIKELESEHPTV